MAEKEYIEREALPKEISADGMSDMAVVFASGYNTCLEDVTRLLTLPDVRPVVLCRDCMYAPLGTDGGEDRGFALEWPHDEWPEDNPCPCKCDDGWYSHKPKPDFFCANGKKREES